MSETKSAAKQNEIDSTRIFPEKSLLYSSDDITRMAEKGSRARLIKQFVGTDNPVHRCFEKHLLNAPNPSQSSENEVPELNQYVTAYPSHVGLRWNPCVEVSSGEEILIQPEPRKTKPSCNCMNCTSKHCPSKKSSGYSKSGYRDNIMRFSDKTTMTPRLNHASCSARTPIASPKASKVSLTASHTQTRFSTGYFSPPPPKPIFKKPCLRPDYYESCYDDAVRDTDMTEDCPILKRAYSRHCVSHIPDAQFESGKRNLYNEGICDKVAEQYPVTPPYCPHRVRFGSQSFCRNLCPDCSCTRPSPKHSKYHQRCNLVEYDGPVYYDVDPEEMQHFVAIPTIVTDRYVSPTGRPNRGPSIILPKKVLTSERDIEAYVQKEKARKRVRCRKFK